MILKATKKGWTLLVRLLLAFGVDINSKGEVDEYLGDKTLLIIAIDEGHTKLAKFLIEKGADLTLRDSFSGKTPLIWASDCGHHSIVSLLLKKGSDINERTKYGSGPLYYAAGNGHTNLVELLLSKGAEVDAVGDFGRTPLIAASIYGFHEIIELLLKNGADPNARCEDGYTALHEAAKASGVDGGGVFEIYQRGESDYLKIVKLVIAKGANVDATYQDSSSHTDVSIPFVYAAWNGHLEIVKYLKSFNPSQKAIKEAIGWAEREGNEQVIKLLSNKKKAKNKIEKKEEKIPTKSVNNELDIPKITSEQLAIDLIDARQLKEPGPGGDFFQDAIQSLNRNQLEEAASHFKEALALGLDPLRQGYVQAELGNIMIKQENLKDAINQYIKVLSNKQALYESVHHASQNLSIILSDIGRAEESTRLGELAIRTQSYLGYSLAQEAAENLRNLIRKTQN